MSVPTILQNIVARKHEVVAERLQRRSLAELEQLAAAASPTRALPRLSRMPQQRVAPA